jgi:methylated-DNA-[protein]-cysteine S-methyltransferase
MTPMTLQHYLSPLGTIWLAASDAGLCGLWFDGQKHQPDFSDAKRFKRGEHRFTQAASEQLQRYFESAAGQATEFQFGKQLPIDLSRGTAFQQNVWQALLRIPMGHTTSYGALAKSLGKPDAVRAVGSAVGRNPISILVPCHRVLGSDGSLTGYAGGMDRKTRLLQMEGVLI